ncbi:DNA-binding transcriptional LysR family regulator [Arthrobacter pigmenti]|uniref:DNA-binding transcriptional LysR family regulator n=1 Tax=Arthrobacter pigmenti TaxID=271432 RepID=A0A846RKD8_9MICC|nr:LysR substrate-binding domain-containing protein [Arthrobacter pigmenti]NJC21599.1 DNA-binding transcriptional LysR family regulator [Arthrobacter pigmenti]
MSERWPNLRALELFVAVVDEGSVGAGARKVGIAQPNASRLVAELELSAGTALVNRSPRGSTPTATGLLFAEQSRAVLNSARQFNDWMRDAGSTEAPELKIGASMTIAEHLLPAWLTGLRRRVGPVRVDLRVLNSAQVLEEVRNGSLQVGFVETPHVPDRLNSMVVQQDELVVVVAPGHEWSGRAGGVSLEELSQTALVVREQGSGTREALQEILAGLHPVEPLQVLGSNAAVRVAVASGAGPAVLSRLALAGQLASGELVSVPLQDPQARRPLTAVWQGPRRLTGAAAELVAVAAQPNSPNPA